MLERMKIEPTEAEIEAEARGKICDWLYDPKLKFHFSRMRRVGRVLREGILSHRFANWAELEPLSANLNLVEDLQSEEISVADREKNPGPEEESAERKADWWLRIFALEGDGNIGFLLPSSMKLSDESPHVHEAYAKIRIRPQKIDGLFVMDLPVFFEKDLADPPVGYGGSHVNYILWNYFDIDEDDLEKFDPELFKFSQQHPKILKEKGPNSVEMEKFLSELSKIRHWTASRFLEEKIGKKIEDIAPIDCLIYFARQRRIPLYLVNKELTQTRVAWPPVK